MSLTEHIQRLQDIEHAAREYVDADRAWRADSDSPEKFMRAMDAGDKLKGLLPEITGRAREAP